MTLQTFSLNPSACLQQRQVDAGIEVEGEFEAKEGLPRQPSQQKLGETSLGRCWNNIGDDGLTSRSPAKGGWSLSTPPSSPSTLFQTILAFGFGLSNLFYT